MDPGFLPCDFGEKLQRNYFLTNIKIIIALHMIFYFRTVCKGTFQLL